MALVDDLLEGGNVVTGLAIGAAALIVWPLIGPLVRPLAKTAIKGGISAYREATRLYDGTAFTFVNDFTVKVIVPPGGQSPEGTVWPDGIVEYTITVKVDEVLKGKAPDNVEFVRRTSAFDTTYDEWFKARTPFLWFVARDKEAVAVSGALRLGEPVTAAGVFRELCDFAPNRLHESSAGGNVPGLP